MNNDLISREALKKAFKDTVCIEPMPYAFVKQIIDNAPTIKTFTLLDIEENFIKGLNIGLSYAPEDRPQGKWLIHTQYEKPEGECSICHTKARLIYGVQYCPFCGAQMQRGGNV